MSFLDAEGQTMFWRCSDTRFAHLLKDNGVDINYRRASDGKTAAHCAVRDRLQLLLDHGADPNLADAVGDTPLHVTMEPQHHSSEVDDEDDWLNLQELKMLLAAGADPNLKNQCGQIGLHIIRFGGGQSAQANDVHALLKVWKESSGDIESRDNEGRTVLLVHSRQDRPGCYMGDDTIYVSKCLLEHGADIHARDKYGKGVLHHACFDQRAAGMIKMLLERGADPLGIDLGGNTPLHDFARHGHSDEQTYWLLSEAGLRLDATNEHNENVLHLASSDAALNQALDLAKEGLTIPDVNAKDDQCRCPIHLAAARSEYSVAALVSKGADPNSYCGERRTPLHIACRARQPNVVGYLLLVLQRKAQLHTIGSKDIHGRTALHDAVRSGVVESVKMLLDAGANVRLTDSKGRTPFEAIDEFDEEQKLWTTSGKGPDTTSEALVDWQRPVRPLKSSRRSQSSGVSNGSQVPKQSCDIDGPMIGLLTFGNVKVGGETILSPSQKMAMDVVTAPKQDPLKDAFEPSQKLTEICTIHFERFESFYNGWRIMSKGKPFVSYDGPQNQTQLAQCMLDLDLSSESMLQDDHAFARQTLCQAIQWGFSNLIGRYRRIVSWLNRPRTDCEEFEPFLHIACRRSTCNVMVLQALLRACSIDPNARSQVRTGSPPDKGSMQAMLTHTFIDLHW